MNNLDTSTKLKLKEKKTNTKIIYLGIRLVGVTPIKNKIKHPSKIKPNLIH